MKIRALYWLLATAGLCAAILAVVVMFEKSHGEEVEKLIRPWGDFNLALFARQHRLHSVLMAHRIVIV